MTDLIDLLHILNPWWGRRTFDTGTIRDEYLTRIDRYLKVGEIVVVNGVRRSGKTTLLFQTIQSLISSGIPPENILMVNGDEPGLHTLKSPFEQILDTYHKEIPAEGVMYLVFDEVQNLPDWEHWIKALYDRRRYRIIISGSSSYLSGTEISTLLSGRYFSVPIYPLDFKEYLSFKGFDMSQDPIQLIAMKYRILTTLKRYLQDGGFPIIALQTEELMKQDYLRAYYDSIVYRDIVRVNSIINPKQLSELLLYLFTNITSTYSYRKLGELFGLESEVVKSYIHYADLASILFEIRQFSYSLKTQARSQKKICCIDGGLRNAICFRISYDEGKLVENLVFIELKRRGMSPYYWKKRGEVDFVVQNPDSSLTAINVCYSDTIPEREYNGLIDFSDEFGESVKNCLILTKDTDQMQGNIRSLPLWRWLLGAFNN